MATIGFLGIGTMGAGMVRNLAKHGHDVLAYNRTQERAEELAAAAERITAVGLDDVLKAEFIITCLSNDDALQGTLIDSRIIERLSEHQVLIDCGTTSIEMTQLLAQQVGLRHAQFLDAPITGSKAGADGGTLLFMIGGHRDAFEHARPVLQAMGTRHVHCGPVTYGQRAKIALNLTQAMILESYLEGLTLAAKEGVPIDRMVEILDNSGAKCGIGSAKLPQVRKRDFEPRFKLGLMHKDLLLAHKEMQKLRLALPLAQQIAKVYEAGLEHRDEDISATAKTLEKQSGMRLE